MPARLPLFVISIDGVSHGLLARLIERGQTPCLARLCERLGPPRVMRSVLPTVSSVAWACYATGRNPGKHGIYGFIDRRPGTRDLMICDSTAMAGPNLWEIMSRSGRRVFGLNVPSTYPPRPVNGVLIGDFLAPSLDRVAYPPAVCDYLKSIDYRTDSDAALARQSKTDMLADLDTTLARLAEAMFHFLGQGPWDFFHTHIMGTDRINHFLLAKYEQGEQPFAAGFEAYYRKVDAVIARVVEAVGPDAPLMILSDHGFCPIRYEVQLSRYLVDRGWTAVADPVRGPLSYDPGRTRTFHLIPGRIYVNLAGRESAGCVPPAEYEAVRQAVARDLLALRDGQGRPVIRKVIAREDLYWPAGQSGPGRAADSAGQRPPYSQAPDLLAVPFDGYDLKMGLNAGEVFVRTELEGMHTYHDALCLARGVQLPDGDLEIRQLAGPILETVGVDPPADLDPNAIPEPAGAQQ